MLRRWGSLLVGFVGTDRFLLPLVVVIIGAVYLYQFDDPTGYDYYPGVIDLPAAALSGTPVECAPKVLAEADEGRLNPWEQLHKEFESLNIDQRLGQPVLAMPFFIAFGSLGFRLSYAFWHVALFLVAFFLVRRLTPGRLAAYAAGLALVFNPFLLTLRSLNPNLETMVLAGFAVLLLADAHRSRAAAMAGGALAGMVFGVAHAFLAMLAMPAFVTLVLLAGDGGARARLRRLAPFAAGFLPVVMTWVWLYGSLVESLPFPVTICIGDTPIVDSLHSGFSRKMMHAVTSATPIPESLCGQDFMGWHSHRLGPLSVTIWGMLNWPLYDSVVRSPGVPFPQFLFIPLLWLRSFGLLFASFFVLRFFKAALRPRRDPLSFSLALLLLIWFGFLAIQENLPGGSKLTYCQLTLLPLAVLAGAELGDLLRKARWQSFLATGVVVGLLWAVTAWSGSATFPLDPRWHGRLEWKKIHECMVPQEEHRARVLQDVLADATLIPAGGFEPVSSAWDIPAKSGAGFWQELDPSKPIPSAMSSLIHSAIRTLPADTQVVVNPYAAPGLAVLSDEEHCVIRAPILKPQFYVDFGEDDPAATDAPDRYEGPIYYVDIPGIPTGPLLIDYSESLVLFNGYCTVHLLETDAEGRRKPATGKEAGP